MKKFFIFLMAGIAMSNYSLAQVWGIPTGINNSFAGSAGKLRISSLTTFEQVNSRTTDTSEYFSRQIQQTLGGDYFIKGISTGIGLNSGFHFFKLTEKEGFSRRYQTQLIVAPKISFKGRYTLSPSIGLTTGYYYSKFHVQNDWGPYFDGYQETSKSYLDYTASILFNTNKFYSGYQLNLFPSISTSEYYFYSNLQAGFTILNNEKSNKSLILQTGINYNHQRKVPYFELHFTGRKKWMVGGIGLNKIHSGSGPDLDIMAGIQLKNIRILYIQNDLGLGIGFGSDFYQFTYSGSLSIRYNFGRENQTQKITN